MYKFVGKKNKLYSLLIDNEMKLNYRCPKGKFVLDSFKCGNTPEESKKNFESLQKDKRNKDTLKRTVRAEKFVGKVSNNDTLKNQVDNVKNLIEKANSELKSGSVSKETYNALKSSVKELKSVYKSKKGMISNKNKVMKPNGITKITDDISNKKLADSESIKQAYASIMHKITEYTSKTNDYRSDFFKELINARNELGTEFENEKKGSSSISLDRINELSNIDINNNITKSLLKSVKKDPNGFIGISAIKQLRLMGLDSSGKNVTDLLTPEESNEYINNKQVVIERIQQNYEISRSNESENRFIELFYKKNLVIKENLKEEKFVSSSEIPLKNPVKYTFVDDNNDMFYVISEEGVPDENMKQLVALVSLTPKILRGENLTTILTTQSSGGAMAYYDYQENEFVSLRSDTGNNGAQSVETVYHELAHGLDARCKEKPYSSTNEYINAINSDNTFKFEINEEDLSENELDMLKEFDETPNEFVGSTRIYESKDGNRYVSEYARSSAKEAKLNKFAEDFAESVSFYFTDPLFKKVYPNRYAYIKAIVGIEGS